MNEEFELLPFAAGREAELQGEDAWEGEWEGERWGGAGRGAGYRGAARVTRPAPRAALPAYRGGGADRYGYGRGGTYPPPRQRPVFRPPHRPPAGVFSRPPYGPSRQMQRSQGPLRSSYGDYPAGAPGRRPGPWGWPAPFPVGRWGWPYGGVDPYALMPRPEPEPPPPEPQAPEPPRDASQVAAAGDDAGAAEPQGEMPPLLEPALRRMPASQRPDYQLIGALTGALRDARATGPGLYLIEFDSNGRRRAYSGESGDLRRRLQQHALCGRMMGIDISGHQVYVAPLPSSTEAQRRRIEKRIHDDMLTRHAGVLTNQRRELEWELPGPLPAAAPPRWHGRGAAPPDVGHAAGCACPACGGFEVMRFGERKRAGRGAAPATTAFR